MVINIACKVYTFMANVIKGLLCNINQNCKPIVIYIYIPRLQPFNITITHLKIIFDKQMMFVIYLTQQMDKFTMNKKIQALMLSCKSCTLSLDI